MEELRNLTSISIVKTKHKIDGKLRRARGVEATLDFGHWNRRTDVVAFWERAVLADWGTTGLIPPEVVNRLGHIAERSAQGTAFLNNPDFETQRAKRERAKLVAEEMKERSTRYVQVVGADIR